MVVWYSLAKGFAIIQTFCWLYSLLSWFTLKICFLQYRVLILSGLLWPSTLQSACKCWLLSSKLSPVDRQWLCMNACIDILYYTRNMHGFLCTLVVLGFLVSIGCTHYFTHIIMTVWGCPWVFPTNLPPSWIPTTASIYYIQAAAVDQGLTEGV